MKYKFLLLSCLVTCGFSSAVYAEDINEIFKRVNEFVTAKNYPKALEELQWAKKEIEKLNTGSLQAFLPDSLGGFTGQKLETTSALGFTNLQRNYVKGESTVKVSLQSSGSGGANGMGGLAALGKMAAMFGGEAGQDTFRIQGRTATLNENGGPELSIFMDSGAILQLQNESGATSADLKAMGEALKLNDIDGYLKGQGTTAPAAN